MRPKIIGGTIGGRYTSPMDERPTTDKHVGPGRYQVTLPINGRRSGSVRPNLGFGIGHGSLSDCRDKTPGAGMYDSNKYRPYSSNGSAFCKSKRGERGVDFNVGPGQYNPYEQKSGNSFSMKFRHEILSKERTPGPGQYSNIGGLRGASGYRIGSGMRDEVKCDRTPGPGTYETVFKWF